MPYLNKAAWFREERNDILKQLHEAYNDDFLTDLEDLDVTDWESVALVQMDLVAIMNLCRTFARHYGWEIEDD